MFSFKPNLNLGYDAKRDRWSGYEPTDFNEQAVSEYEKMEEARKLIRVEKVGSLIFLSFQIHVKILNR
jgi:hypothetical protein